jgi:hypothetical protein
MITIKGNEASEYYADFVTPLWNELDIDIQRFNAVTPETLHLYPLVFGNRQDNDVSTTQTERASTCSHYLLWKKCIELNERIFVLEHDAYPDPAFGDNFYDNTEFEYYGFAPGNAAYVIDPVIAKHFCETIENRVICGGTLAQVHHFSKPPWKALYNFTDISFEIKVKQLISRKYGSTSNHSMLYETTLTFKDGDILECGTKNINRIFEVID